MNGKSRARPPRVTIRKSRPKKHWPCCVMRWAVSLKRAHNSAIMSLQPCMALRRANRHAFNNILLAEAGTGLGKTLGYLSPAWVWAQKNKRPVWLSTYTKNLQRQLDQESARLLPNPEERAGKIVIRKGRENYLCLLNMQESFGRLQAQGPRGALLAVLLARWASASRDGDLIGGDFPSWIFGLFPGNQF